MQKLASASRDVVVVVIRSGEEGEEAEQGGHTDYY